MSNEIVCGREYWPFLPDGSYQAQCIRYDEKFLMGKSRKLFLSFRIVDPGEHHGLEIFQAYNIPYDRKTKPGSKYYKTWVIVNGYRKPSRNAQMSPRLFVNKIFRVKTRTVKPLHNGKPMPQHFWYSVVDYIIEIVAG
jgi:hypothetical protein